MSSLSPEAVKHHIRIYIGVFIALAVLTVVTVAASYLDVSMVPAIIIALVIASIKGCLVAGFFMHLKWEKKIIYYLLLVCAVFFLLLLFIPAMTS